MQNISFGGSLASFLSTFYSSARIQQQSQQSGQAKILQFLAETKSYSVLIIIKEAEECSTCCLIKAGL